MFPWFMTKIFAFLFIFFKSFSSFLEVRVVGWSRRGIIESFRSFFPTGKGMSSGKRRFFFSC